MPRVEGTREFGCRKLKLLITQGASSNGAARPLALRRQIEHRVNGFTLYRVYLSSLAEDTAPTPVERAAEEKRGDRRLLV
jgi:hypothetical protein